MFKSQERLIAEIHNEFDTAQERLLEEANQLLASLSPQPEGIAERLKRIGFSNTPTVKRVEAIQQEKKMAEDQAKLILYYKQTYPFLKFLTESELERICDKYNLIFAKVDRYVKEVPEKNLRDIEQAQELKEDDAINALDLKAERLRTERLARMPKEDWYMEARNPYRNFYMPMMFSESAKLGLSIAAPESHFNLKGLVKTSTFGWGKPEVKDPIVFRYVRGGIQVLTKWGIEGEDPMLYNEKFN